MFYWIQNAQSETQNAKCNVRSKSDLTLYISHLNGWAQLDLNQRPADYESAALTV